MGAAATAAAAVVLALRFGLKAAMIGLNCTVGYHQSVYLTQVGWRNASKTEWMKAACSLVVAVRLAVGEQEAALQR